MPYCLLRDPSIIHICLSLVRLYGGIDRDDEDGGGSLFEDYKHRERETYIHIYIYVYGERERERERERDEGE